jgi:hypothetical protein
MEYACYQKTQAEQAHRYCYVADKGILENYVFLVSGIAKGNVT